MVILDKTECHWDLGERSQGMRTEQWQDLLFFEPMISELQSLPGDLDHLISMTQFMYCVVLPKLVYLFPEWVVAKFWCPWDPKPVTQAIFCSIRLQRKLKARKVKWLAQGHSEFSSWARTEIYFLFSLLVFSALIHFTQGINKAGWRIKPWTRLTLALALALPRTLGWLSISRLQITYW